MQLQTSSTRVTLVLQTRLPGITSFSDNTIVDRQMIQGLHHLTDVRLLGVQFAATVAVLERRASEPESQF